PLMYLDREGRTARMSNSRALVTSSVLVVSDDPAARTVARARLEHETRHVFEANIADAIAIARCIRLDTIVVGGSPVEPATTLRAGLVDHGLTTLRVVRVGVGADVARALRDQVTGTTRSR